ncbi:MAG: hypothetical protein IK058_05670 [Bacteroidales bacterium]|nr:hypothetical protein [Bacteroidales bacterium]
MMKTNAFVAAVLLLALVGCISKPERTEYWMSYDDIDLLASPTDTAAVVKQLNGRVTPFSIEQRDSSGEWGLYVVSRGTFSKTVSGWLPLKEMVYAGSDDLNEHYETFTVKPKEMPMYKHPKVNKKDIYGRLHQGDTVLATTKSGNWMHVYYTRFGHTGRQRENYGWVQTSQLQKIDSLTRQGVKDYMLAKSVTEQANDKENVSYLESRQKGHTVYQNIGIVIGYLAMAMALVFLVFAIRRKKVWDVVILFVMGVLILGISQAILVSTWWYAFMIPLMAYVLCYPLLYFDKTSGWFGYLFPALALLAAAYYIFMCTNLLHPTFWRVVGGVVLAAACVAETLYVRKRKERDICPFCGYYAKHSRGSRHDISTSTSHGTETKDEFVKRTETQSGNTKYITDHYNRVTYDTETTTTIYEIDRTCMRCEKVFQNHGESKVKTRRRR